MIKNIIFDLGGVILNDTPKEILNNLSISEYESKVIREKFFQNLYELDKGNKTIKEYYEECNLPEEIKQKYQEILCHYYQYRSMNQDILKLIKKLKQNNYHIYILSDNNKETYDYIKNLKEFSSIDGYVISCDYGVSKSNEQIYKILLNKYNLKIKECYFIDDKKENINIAKKLGIKGFIFHKEKFNECLINMIENNINLE